LSHEGFGSLGVRGVPAELGVRGVPAELGVRGVPAELGVRGVAAEAAGRTGSGCEVSPQDSSLMRRLPRSEARTAQTLRVQ